jgi:RNA polymerase sigma factor (sigma-70 family)
MTDWQLLRKFTQDNSQAAFAELSQRYTNLVYRVCQRELGDTSLAEDAAQAVFLLLARKAPSLHPSRQEATLSSWLFQAALLTAKNARRQEQRRAAKEQEAAQMPPPTASLEWIEIEPLLNDALEALPPGQRSLLIERFFYDRPLAEIGAGQGISEDAARMRVNRALDRLRRFFAARNVALSAAALAAVLPSAVYPAPVHAAEAIARLTLPTANDNTPAQTLAQGVLHTMNLKRLKLQLGAAALVAVFVLGTAGAVRVTAQMKARRVAAAEQENQAQALTVLNQMYATYAAMHSFSCHVTSRDDSGVAIDGDYEIDYPNKVRFSRFTLMRDMSGQALAVSNGSYLYTTCTESNGTVHGAADRYAKQQVRFVGPPNVPQDLNPWFASFGGIGFSYGVEPDAGMPAVALGMRLHGVGGYSQMLPPVYSLGPSVVQDLQGTPGPASYDVVIAHIPYALGVTNRDWSGAAVIVTYYIGQRDHLLHKLTAADPLSQKDWDTRIETYDSIAVNPKLPASDFVFTPAPGSHEVRDTVDLFPGSRGH